MGTGVEMTIQKVKIFGVGVSVVNYSRACEEIISAAKQKLYYMVVVMSNVLRKNSAVAHQTLATRIHKLIQSSK